MWMMNYSSKDNCSFTMNFLFLSSCLLCYATGWNTLLNIQKTQNVGIDACVDKSDEYCNEIIENSECDVIKNECYCKKGFVAIREDERITCKTLLTNLKCRIDSDCVHVDSSSCHPAAGRCTCPPNTVLVADLHACRTRIRNNLMPFCSSCMNNRGECFVYNKEDRITAFYNDSKMIIGCACPSSSRSSVSKSVALCNLHSVDIGEFCDEKSYFCKSKNAICTSQNSLSSQSRFCTCELHHVSVYQKSLDYHDCISRGKFSTKCAKCEKIGGVCYDENGDSKPESCKCPNHLSHITEIDNFSNDDEICSVRHVEVQCSASKFLVCYKAHFHPPYDSLYQRIKQNSSFVGINILLPNNQYQEDCFANLIKQNLFCFNASNSKRLLSCMIYTVITKSNQIVYQAELQVVYDPSKPAGRKNLIFPIKCVADAAYDKKYMKYSFPIFENENRKTMEVSLDFVNNVGHVAHFAQPQQMVRLRISIRDPKPRYFLRAEQCFLSTDEELPNTDYQKLKIVEKGCPTGSLNFSVVFSKTISKSGVILSAPFMPFQKDSEISITIKCVIKVCEWIKQCELPICSKFLPVHKKLIPDPISGHEYFVEKWTQLIATKPNKRLNGNTPKKMTCNHLICLTTPQTLLLSFLLFFLVITIVILLIIYAKTKTEPHRLAQTLDYQHEYPMMARRHSVTICRHAKIPFDDYTDVNIFDPNGNLSKDLSQENTIPTKDCSSSFNKYDATNKGQDAIFPLRTYEKIYEC